jgi:hypothetical protein
MPSAIADLAGTDRRAAEAASEIYRNEIRDRDRMNLAKKSQSIRERMCPMIHVYGDDGADAKKERVLAVAVIAGTEEWWQNVESQWIVRCGWIPFHATDCESNQGDYKNIPKEENKAMYRDLTGILASSLLGGIGIAIDLAAQKQILPGALPLAYYRAFLECVERAANVARTWGKSQN